MTCLATHCQFPLDGKSLLSPSLRVNWLFRNPHNTLSLPLKFWIRHCCGNVHSFGEHLKKNKSLCSKTWGIGGECVLCGIQKLKMGYGLHEKKSHFLFFTVLKLSGRFSLEGNFFMKDEPEHFLAIFTPLWHSTIKVRSSTYPSLIGLKWLTRTDTSPWIAMNNHRSTARWKLY